MPGYRVPKGYRVLLSPWAPPYAKQPPAMNANESNNFYGRRSMGSILFTNPANVYPEEGSLIKLTNDLGDTYAFVFDRGTLGPPAPVAGCVQTVAVDISGGVTNQNEVRDAMISAVSGVADIRILAFSVDSGKVMFAAEYPTPLGDQQVTPESVGAASVGQDSYSHMTGGAYPQAAVPAVMGPKRGLLGTIISTDPYGYE